MRNVALRTTTLSRAHVATIRNQLLKIGTIVIRNTRRVQLLMSSAHFHQALFRLAALRLEPGLSSQVIPHPRSSWMDGLVHGMLHAAVSQTRVNIVRPDSEALNLN